MSECWRYIYRGGEWWRYVYRGGWVRELTAKEKEELVRIWLFSKWWNSPECSKKRVENRINYIGRSLQYE